MSESGKARPEQAQLYRSPASEGVHADSGYTSPGVPAPRTVGNEQLTGHPHQAPERTQDQRGGSALSGQLPPGGAVGDRVVHRVSGQAGTVVGHERHGYSGTAQPQVQWAGEEASWPQGVSANALRVDGSTPVRLYETNQDATSHPPLNRQTGAL